MKICKQYLCIDKYITCTVYMSTLIDVNNNHNEYYNNNLRAHSAHGRSIIL